MPSGISLFKYLMKPSDSARIRPSAFLYETLPFSLFPIGKMEKREKIISRIKKPKERCKSQATLQIIELLFSSLFKKTELFFPPLFNKNWPVEKRRTVLLQTTLTTTTDIFYILQIAPFPQEIQFYVFFMFSLNWWALTIETDKEYERFLLTKKHRLLWPNDERPTHTGTIPAAYHFVFSEKEKRIPFFFLAVVLLSSS